jgi:hypothetical protein
MDLTAIHGWLAAYRRAWKTDAREDIAALFSDGVRYFTAPYREPLRGIDEVASYWVGEKESGIPWTFEPRVLARERDLYVVEVLVRYPEGESAGLGAREYRDIWLVTLAEDGRARKFVEYFMLTE